MFIQKRFLTFKFSIFFGLSSLAVLASTASFGQQTIDTEAAYDERDIKFAFVTQLSAEDKSKPLGEDLPDIPDISDGDVLSGADILKRLDASGQSDKEQSQQNLLTDHMLGAYIQHPVSGKSLDLQIGLCPTLDYLTGPDPFPQQVKCGDDIYSYRAGAYGVEILLNEDVFFDIPLDAGNYRLNGVDVRFKAPDLKNKSGSDN